MKFISLVIAAAIVLCCACADSIVANQLPRAKEIADFLPVGTAVRLIPTASEKYDIRIGSGENRSNPNDPAARQRTQWAIKEAQSNTDPVQKARMQRLINELQAESIAVTRYKVVISARDFIAFEAVDSDAQSWIVLPIASIHSIRK